MIDVLGFLFFAAVMMTIDIWNQKSRKVKYESLRREWVVYGVFLAAAVTLAIVYYRDPYQASIARRLGEILGY